MPTPLEELYADPIFQSVNGWADMSPQPFDPTANEDPRFQYRNDVPEVQQQKAAVPTPKVTSLFDLVKQQEPVEDTMTAEKARKAAILTGVGQTLGNLAGAVGNFAGGRVPVVQPNNNIANLYGIVDREKDKYDTLKRDWQNKVIQAKFQDIQSELAGRLDVQSEYNKAKMEQANTQWLLDHALKGKEFDLKTGHYKTQEEIAKENADSNRIRANKTGSRADKENQPVIIETSSGKKYKLNPEKLALLTTQGVGNPNIVNNPKYAGLFTKVEIMENGVDKMGYPVRVGTGQYTYRVNPNADKHALARVMLELQEKDQDIYNSLKLPDEILRPQSKGQQAPPSGSKKFDYTKLK